MGSAIVEFANFKLDCDGFELSRDGRDLKLQRKPLELLILLAESQGRLVSRTEIAERLWGKRSFCRHRARHQHRQSARFDRRCGTIRKSLFSFKRLPARGYRFVARVVEVEPRIFAASNGLPHPAGSVSFEDRSGLGIQNGASPSQQQPGVAAPVGREAAAHNEEEGKAEPSTAAQCLAIVGRNSMRARIAVSAMAILALVLIGWGIGVRYRSAYRDPSARPNIAEVQIDSLAVLPLENLSSDRSQDYFADGMTDELITMLAKNSTLRVTSRTSVMQYKGIHRSLKEIAKELGVGGIVEGSVVRSGDKVHLSLQLIHAGNDAHLWADSFDRDRANVVSLAGEAAQTIAARLHRVAKSPSSQRYISPEAHDAYLRARYYESSGDWAKAVEFSKKATELQPDYALAWTELSTSYGGSTQIADPADFTFKSKEAARRAIELDDSLPEAHNNLAGIAFFADWDWDRALAESARTIELNPNYAFGHSIRSRLLLVLNRNQESLTEVRIAKELNPAYDPELLAWNLYLMRRYDAALDAYRLVQEIQPNNGSVHEGIAAIYKIQGKNEEAARELVKAYELNGATKTVLTKIRKLAIEPNGFKEIKQLDLDDLEKKARQEYVSPLYLSGAYASVGQKEQTLHYLELAFKERSPGMVFIQVDPWYDFLHSEPRYRAIVQKMGLPPAY